MVTACNSREMRLLKWKSRVQATFSRTYLNTPHAGLIHI
jgi:hypothetical protein